MNTDLPSACPLPFNNYPNILLAHGGGGKLMNQLIEKMFVQAFDNPALSQRHDGAVLEFNGQRIAFATDSYVVQPLFFPGGDIGSLAVNGTVNDLAMCGARPKWLSAGFIIEEGFSMETLWRVVQSMRKSADEAGVQLVTGDTKVVDKGKGDGLFINTAGIGIVEHQIAIHPGHVQPGDVILINGDVGRHGMAIMSVREGLKFETVIESDCAPLASLVLALLDAGIEIHCMRDLTRGGLASALNEIADAAQVQIAIDESSVPVRDDVLGACEILGFDPLYVANEGRFIAIISPRDLTNALKIMHAHRFGEGACFIGTVTGDSEALVTLKSRIGTSRILDMLSGEQLPRIC
ncbi:MAG: hydrogenase expression/formation protein HypE [Verrucomicrobiota bacterium]